MDILNKLRNKKIVDIAGKGVQGWEELVNSIVSDYGPVGNSTAEQLCCADFNIPRFYLAPGRVLRYEISGFITTVASSCTITNRVRWGGLAGTLLNSTGALNMVVAANTYNPFVWKGTLTCRTNGPTGSIYSAGLFQPSNRLTSETTPGFLTASGGGLTANAPVTVDTTTDKLLSFTTQFSVANAAILITVQQALLEALN